MQYVRWLHSMDFHPDKGRFGIEAFANRPGKDGRPGLSLICHDCIVRKSGTVCEHSKLYKKFPKADKEAMYWKFPAASFPTTGKKEIPKRAHKRNDPCHFTVWETPDDHLVVFFESANMADFRICAPDGDRPLRVADIIRLRTENNA